MTGLKSLIMHLLVPPIKTNGLQKKIPLIIKSPKAHLNAQVHELPWFPAEKSTNLD